MRIPQPVDDGIWFAQPQVALSNDGQFGSGVSFGRRWFDAPANRVFGAALSLDAYQTQMNEVAPQGVLSLETRGQAWDIFANGYLPLGDQTRRAASANYGRVMFQVAGTDTMNATVTDSAFNGNAAPSTFQFGPNAGALMNLNLVGNEDSVGYSFERDPNGFLRIGGTLGTGNFFNDDNGNVANNGNTTLGGATNIVIVGAGNQIQIIPPPSIIVP